MNIMKFIAGIVSVMLACDMFSASTITAGQYYFTTPRTNLIQGRVMGPNADYRLIRYEDIAWLKEAYAERKALSSDSYDKNTNVTSVLISHKANFDRIDTGFIDPESVSDISNFVVNSSEIDFFSTGARPIDINTIDPSPRSLISIGWLTNAFAKIEKAHSLVFGRAFESSDGEAVYSYSYENNYAVYTNWHLEVRSSSGSYTSTNLLSSELYAYKYVLKESTSTAYVPERGNLDWNSWVLVEGPSFHDSVESHEGYASYSSEIYHQCDTNAWMRGNSYPMFYNSAKVFGIVNIEEELEKYDENGKTNYADRAYVFMKISDGITFKGVYDDGIIWSFSFAPSAIASTASSLAGMNGPSWVNSAAASYPEYPENSDIGRLVSDFFAQTQPEGPDETPWAYYSEENDEHSDERSFEMNIRKIFVVFDLSPATMLSSEE